MKRLRELNMLTLIGGILVLLGLVFVANLLIRGMRVAPAPPEWEIAGADPDRAEAAIARYGCGSCHVIPGIPHAQGRVGPELDRLIDQVFIAGRLPNTPENLVMWIRHPRHVDPATAMPDLGVTDQEARDIASYLYSRR